MEGELFSISYTVQETTSESVLNHTIVSKVPVCFREYEGTAHMKQTDESCDEMSLCVAFSVLGLHLKIYPPRTDKARITLTSRTAGTSLWEGDPKADSELVIGYRGIVTWCHSTATGDPRLDPSLQLWESSPIKLKQDAKCGRRVLLHFSAASFFCCPSSKIRIFCRAYYLA